MVYVDMSMRYWNHLLLCSIWPLVFMSVLFYLFMKFGSLLFVVCIFTIVIYSWWIIHLLICKYLPYLFWLIWVWSLIYQKAKNNVSYFFYVSFIDRLCLIPWPSICENLYLWSAVLGERRWLGLVFHSVSKSTRLYQWVGDIYS